jgi:hypothetical protein
MPLSVSCTPATPRPCTARVPWSLLLLAAAALDLARCGIALATAGHLAPVAGLVAAGVTAAALSLRTARGCRGGRRWSGWAALLVGAMSAPQAALSGFRPPYQIPDTATAVLGIQLTVTVLAIASRPRQAEPGAETTCDACPGQGGQNVVPPPPR